MGEQNQSEYTFDTKTGHLTITTKVENSAPWDEFKSKVKKVTIAHGITRIWNNAFADYKKLAEVDLPDSLVEIEDSAFNGCKSLVDIRLPQGISALGDSVFENCSSLKSANIPDSYVEDSEYSLFYHCSSLETLHIGKNPISFDSEYFTLDGCYALKEIIVHPENEDCISVDGVMYYKENNGKIFKLALFPPSSPITTLNILEGTTNLYPVFSAVFFKAKNLKEVIFPDSIKELNSGMFEQCENLEKIEIGNGCKKINKGFVNKCTSLRHIVIGDNLEEIEADAFKGCKQIETIDLSPKNEHFLLEDGVLYSCIMENGIRKKKGVCLSSVQKKVEEFVIPDGTEVIAKNAFFKCKTLKELTLPPTVKRIEEGAFCGCSSLKSISFPDSLEYIGKEAFMKCSGLKSIRFNEGLKEISAHAFDSCTKLESIHLPSTLTSIKEYAFVDCFKLNTIISDAKEPPFFTQVHYTSVGFKSPFFQSAYHVTVWVDKDAVDTYKSAWNTPFFEVRAKGDTQTPSYRKTPKLRDDVSGVCLYNGKTVLCFKDHFEIDGQSYPCEKAQLSKWDGLIHASCDDENLVFRHGKLESLPQGPYSDTRWQSEDVLISSEGKDGIFYLSVVYEGRKYEINIEHTDAEELSASAYMINSELLFLVESSNYLMFYNATGKQLWSFDTKKNDSWSGAQNYIIGTTIVHQTHHFEGAFNILTGEKLWESDTEKRKYVVGPDGMLYSLKYSRSTIRLRMYDLILLKLDPQTGNYTTTIVDTKYEFFVPGSIDKSVFDNKIYYTLSGDEVFYGVLNLDTLQIEEENVVIHEEEKRHAHNQNYSYHAFAPIVNDGKIYVKSTYLNVFDK